MRLLTLLSALLPVVASAADTNGYLGYTCVNPSIDSNGVFTASCDNGAGTNTKVTSSLDLNGCFGFTGNEIVEQQNGHFGKSCGTCHAYTQTVDEFGEFYNAIYVDCTCTGVQKAVTIDTDRYLSNDHGAVRCDF